MQNHEAVELLLVRNTPFFVNSATTLKTKNERGLFDDAIRGSNCRHYIDYFFDSWSLPILFFNTKSYDKACKAIRYEN
jgi:hypothetical protein